MIPELTEEQRKANLEKAMKMRKERADIRAKLANGTYTVADVIYFADSRDKAAAGLRVKQMINALPGYGFKKTQALMRELGISENKRVGGLGVNQAKALIDRLGGEWQ